MECNLAIKSKDKLFKHLALKRNSRNLNKFLSSDFSKRIILVPHCLRNIKRCKANEEGGYYICAECGSCKIDKISRKSKELGYKAIFILKGGRIADKIIKDLKPEAVLGVACFYEGSEGIKLCEKNKVTVQFVPLTKDGCADTDVDLDEVFKVLALK